jgi:hypothetical protein
MNPEPNATPDTTPEPAPKQEPQSSQAIDWQARYNGLNSAYSKLQKRHEDLQAKFDQLSEEHETSIQGSKKHDAEKTDLSSKIASLEREKQELSNQLSKQSFKDQRIKLILTDFPDLTTFEADGLLPDADTIENLKPKLESFRTALERRTKNGVQEKLKGLGPTPANRTNITPITHSREFLYARLSQLAGHRTPEQQVEYQQLQAEFDELTKDEV